MMDGGSSEQGGRRAMAQLLATEPPPTAVFCANDSMTVGALRALREAGLQVPGDIALVCFDDFPWADAFEPALTTVAQPCFAIGARAIQLLVRRMKDPGAPHQTCLLYTSPRQRDRTRYRMPCSA